MVFLFCFHFMRCTMWRLHSSLSVVLICMSMIASDKNSVFSMSSTVTITQRSSQSYPNPRTDHQLCKRRRPSFVCDPDELLLDEQADRLDFLLSDMRHSTPCLCSVCSKNEPRGISIGIFIRENFTNDERSAVRFSSQELAKKLREEWKLGICDNDIIIVVTAEEKKSSISLGSAVESVLPYRVAEQIAKDCNVHFESNYTYFAQGLKAMVNSFHDILQQSPTKETRSARRKKIGISIGIALGVIVIIILVVSGAILVWRHFQKKKTAKAEKSKKPSDSEPYEYQLCKIEDSTTANEEDKDSSDSDDAYHSDNGDFGLEIDLQKQGIYRKRELSDVAEEAEDASPAEDNAMVMAFPINNSHSLEVTEL